MVACLPPMARRLMQVLMMGFLALALAACANCLPNQAARDLGAQKAQSGQISLPGDPPAQP